MVDLHSHILPGLDDGINNFEDAKRAIEEAKLANFDTIVATTHYSNCFNSEEPERQDLLRVLQGEITGVKLALGSEIYLNSNISDFLKNKKASTINGTRYLLFELPIRNENCEFKNIVIDLMAEGYKLILAHPERYIRFQKKPEELEEVMELGIFLQANFLSILGKYGDDAKKLVKILFKHNMISFLGTDIHRCLGYYPRVKEASKKIVSIIGKDKFDEITNVNPTIVLEDKNIYAQKYKRIEKNFWGIYR